MELLQRLQAGDEGAFTEIYNLYWEKLYFLAHKRLKNVALAEEVVQEVFLNVWRKKHTLEIQTLEPYLATMLRHAVYRQMAQLHKEQAAGERNEQAVNTESTIENKLLLEKISTLSNRLPEKCRLVFVHNKMYDKPVQQVATELGISVKTAEAHLTKALKLMRRHLGNAATGVVPVLFFYYK